MAELDGFEAWYRSSYAGVVASVSVLAGSTDLARDCVDEAYSRALERWARVSAMSSPTGWVYRVAFNVLRRKERRRSVERRLFAAHATSDPVLPPTTTEVWALVSTLPRRQRMAVVLRFIGDLPEAEVAEIMGVTRGAVSSSIAAATKRLRSELTVGCRAGEGRHAHS